MSSFSGCSMQVSRSFRRDPSDRYVSANCPPVLRAEASFLKPAGMNRRVFATLSRDIEAGGRENEHGAFRNSHAPAFRGGARGSASGTQKRWVGGFRP